MSPVRDPADRSIRRMQRDSVEGKPGETTPPAAPAGRARGDAEDDSTARQRMDRGALGDEDLDRLPLRQRRRGRRDAPAQRRVDRLRVESPPSGAGEEGAGEPAAVVALSRGYAEVELAGGESVLVHLPKALGRARDSELAVGDRVRIERRAGEAVIAGLLSRTSRLSRPDPLLAHRERVIAANVELAVVVSSVRRPALSPGLIDRILVALAHGGVASAIAVNKVDLVTEPRAEDAELALIAPYRALESPVLLCSTRTGEGLEALRELIAGRMVAFVGHSGVGKSSLLNALAPEAAAAVSEGAGPQGRGRHTTTRARVYRLSRGTRLVDTPGIREFGLWKMTTAELAAYFDEFAVFAAGCRFADCTHSHEPRCAVRAAVDAGELSGARYETYRRILASLDET